MQNISEHLRRVEQAIHDAQPAVKASAEWGGELSNYAATLRELQSWLGKIEITLRIRRAQTARARKHLYTVHSWATLASHIG